MGVFYFRGAFYAVFLLWRVDFVPDSSGNDGLEMIMTPPVSGCNYDGLLRDGRRWSRVGKRKTVEFRVKGIKGLNVGQRGSKKVSSHFPWNSMECVFELWKGLLCLSSNGSELLWGLVVVYHKMFGHWFLDFVWPEWDLEQIWVIVSLNPPGSVNNLYFIKKNSFSWFTLLNKVNKQSFGRSWGRSF